MERRGPVGPMPRGSIVHNLSAGPQEVETYVPKSELDEAIEGCERLTREREEARELEQEAVDRLRETLDLLRGIAADSADPASRACAQAWLRRVAASENPESTEEGQCSGCEGTGITEPDDEYGRPAPDEICEACDGSGKARE
jgi:hypothetical protein